MDGEGRPLLPPLRLAGAESADGRMMARTPRGGSRRRRAGLRRWSLIAVLAACATIGALIAPAGVRASTAAQLQRLARLDAAQIEAVVRADPARLLELANANPEETAREWPRVPKGERAQLERLLPGFVGNFDGVPYATRDRANKQVLQQRLASAQAAVVSRPSDTGNVLALAAYKAIRAAVTVKSHPARHLVEFVPGARPTAAIAIGNLDTASMITWVIPGMGTYTTDMQLWTLAAQNVWAAQRDAGAPADHAVIAWMGYVVPPVGIDAALGEYAARGAPLLTEAIRGVRAVRADRLPVLNVVAHSYGTTMAADALADSPLGIGTMVLLGSAGIEETIRDAAVLHADAVYAGEATADEEAALGRFSRVDPRNPSFGARVLAVDGDAAAGLSAVTGHAPILHSSYNDDIATPVWTVIASVKAREAAYREHLAEHGYLDRGTQSLQQVGIVTAGTRPTPGGPSGPSGTALLPELLSGAASRTGPG
ncbi:alpha/beta hydrolase [Leifsonia virtsii]|uniref:Alpha/beta hydrolase n=1 Tax=Leifsonia virtsii TaxID=3035915 RepID=A0ABT8IV97_9MICO|nr:alpha/beta hydrolase [Leifsonia virtsii]MDN4596715.1 alpha/beta hydrolase [Leifsonia virtsii]